MVHLEVFVVNNASTLITLIQAINSTTLKVKKNKPANEISIIMIYALLACNFPSISKAVGIRSQKEKKKYTPFPHTKQHLGVWKN